MTNPIIKAELSKLVKDADTELLDQQRTLFRARAKNVLQFKERMESSIAECEKDLEEARKKLTDFKAKLALVDETQDMDAFQELEKAVNENVAKFYVPATTGYVHFQQSYQVLGHGLQSAMNCGGTSTSTSTALGYTLSST